MERLPIVNSTAPRYMVRDTSPRLPRVAVPRMSSACFATATGSAIMNAMAMSRPPAATNGIM